MWRLITRNKQNGVTSRSHWSNDLQMVRLLKQQQEKLNPEFEFLIESLNQSAST